MKASIVDDPNRDRPFSVIMIGGTGVTGALTVKELLTLPNLKRLVLLVRKAGKPEDPRIEHVEVNFDKLGFEFKQREAALGHFDIMISTLGTTKSQAGSRDNYRKVEVEYPRDFARMCRRWGRFFSFFFLFSFFSRFSSPANATSSTLFSCRRMAPMLAAW